MNPFYQQQLLYLSDNLQVLPDKPEESPEITLMALWGLVQGENTSTVSAQNLTLEPLSDEQQNQLKALIEQRMQGVPLAHLTQRQGFMGLEFHVSTDALIPRAETEILARLALQCLEDKQDSKVTVFDICTGCGNIALTIADRIKTARVYAADLSAQAISLAIENSKQLGLEKQVTFKTGDLLSPFDTDEFTNQVDLLVCNPPYIISSNVEKMAPEISGHEPSLAFDGGPLGIAIIDRIIREAPKYLKQDAWLCLEIGAGQGPFIEKRLNKNEHYYAVESVTDNNGVVRAISAKKK